jgi:hypothetical protein
LYVLKRPLHIVRRLYVAGFRVAEVKDSSQSLR